MKQRQDYAYKILSKTKPNPNQKAHQFKNFANQKINPRLYLQFKNKASNHTEMSSS